MPGVVRVIGPRDPKDPEAINTTSRSTTWSRGLSPFFLGPCEIPCAGPNDPGGLLSLNMENAWQYAKVYPCHVDASLNPTEAYWSWARAGWAKERADRYPMGKGARPLYSLWGGERLGYVDARFEIYIPLYALAVRDTQAFRTLRDIFQRNGHVTLWDFDGYDHLALGMSLEEVALEPSRKMGHAFVLAMLLLGEI